MKIEDFAKEEELKDYLLYIVKNDPNQRMEESIIEPASKIIIQIMKSYIEILDDEGQEDASDYLFHSMSNNVLLITQLIEMNKNTIKKVDELIDINEKLLERINE